MKKLSILVCSIKKRSMLLERLMHCISPQLEAYPNDLELIVEVDEGEITIGRKRQILLEKATSSHVIFIDDDDIICQNYSKRILGAIDNKCDAVALRGCWIEGGNQWRSMYWRKDYKDSFKQSFSEVFIKTNHICAIRREIPMMFGTIADGKGIFDDISIGEDTRYGERINQFLEKEITIHDEPLYHYNFDRSHTDVFNCRRKHHR